MKKLDLKLILFDSYGVVLFGGYPDTCRYLGKKFKRDWQELYEVIYKKYFNIAAERKISQQEAWQKSTRELGLDITVSEIKKIHYGFMSVNQKVLSTVKKLQKQYKVALLTKNTRSQLADTTKRFSALKATFGKNLLNTWEYGLPKASLQTIRFVCQKYSVKPNEILYIDDQEANLEPAKKLGAKTIFYKNFNQFKGELREYIYA